MNKTILASRTISGEPLAESSTREFYKYLVSQYGISELPLIMCNSLEKKTCLTYRNGKSYLVFDTSTIELFHMLNVAMESPFPDDYLKAIFYLFSSEQYFLNGRYSLALQFAAKYLNVLDVVMKCMKYEIDNRNDDLLFIQQAFLLSHEVYHYWLSLDIDRYNLAIRKKSNLLNNIYVYAQQILESELGEFFKKAIGNSVFVEECLCDSMGAISAINIGSVLKQQDESKAASSIIKAVGFQFILSCIESFNEQINSEIKHSDLSEFNIRMLQLKAFLSKLLRNDYGSDVSDIFENSIESIDLFISHAIDYLGKLYSKESLALKAFFYDDDTKVDLELRKQLLKIYSI